MDAGFQRPLDEWVPPTAGAWQAPDGQEAWPSLSARPPSGQEAGTGHGQPASQQSQSLPPWTFGHQPPGPRDVERQTQFGSMPSTPVTPGPQRGFSGPSLMQAGSVPTTPDHPTYFSAPPQAMQPASSSRDPPPQSPGHPKALHIPLSAQRLQEMQRKQAEHEQRLQRLMRQGTRREEEIAPEAQAQWVQHHQPMTMPPMAAAGVAAVGSSAWQAAPRRPPEEAVQQQPPQAWPSQREAPHGRGGRWEWQSARATQEELPSQGGQELGPRQQDSTEDAQSHQPWMQHYQAVRTQGSFSDLESVAPTQVSYVVADGGGDGDGGDTWRERNVGGFGLDPSRHTGELKPPSLGGGQAWPLP